VLALYLIKTATSSINYSRGGSVAKNGRGRIEGVGKGAVEGQVRFVESLFKVAA